MCSTKRKKKSLRGRDPPSLPQERALTIYAASLLPPMTGLALTLPLGLPSRSSIAETVVGEAWYRKTLQQITTAATQNTMPISV
mmetsp:Transcript_98601/g.277263  ORF Transcript_98601/g.277263 Transcript_98601/m.277263 type:complete len:84 (-) Transcript_98601:276-527(-)